MQKKMKSLLGALGSLAILGTVGGVVVACNQNTTDTKPQIKNPIIDIDYNVFKKLKTEFNKYYHSLSDKAKALYNAIAESKGLTAFEYYIQYGEIK